MSDTLEKLRQELQAAQRTVAELQAKLENRETTYRLTTLELEENRSALLFMLEDLEAGRKKIEHSHQEWMAALDVVDDPIFLHDKEFRILRCNKAYQQCAGISFEQIIGRPYYAIFPKADTPLPCCLRAMEKAEEEEEEEVAVGDAIYRSRAFSIHDKQGAYLYSVHTLEDITEHKHQEEQTAALLELYTSAETFDEKKLLQRGLDTVQHLTGSRIGFLHFVSESQNEIGLVTWSNDTLAHYCQAAFDGHYPVSAAGIWADCIRLKQSVIINDYATASGKKGLPEGHAHLQRFISMPVFDGTLVRMIIGVGNAAIDYGERDVEVVKLFGYGLYRIVQRKRAEAEIEHANRALTALSTVNRTLVHATDENELLQAICQAIVKQRGYRLVWVGYVQHDAAKSIKIMAHAGHDGGYMDAMQLTWAESERGMGPSGRAVRSGATQVCQDMANDPQFLPWREAALERGYASCITLPLTRRSGKVFGILSVYSAEVNAFSPAEIDLLEEMSGDLAFGVRSLYIRSQRDLAHERIQQQLVQLQSNLEDTVRAIATIVEMRDPYTAGHQARVADLAAAIARQMGLTDEQVHGIHLAGTLHDLGKIQIPAEILSKPGKISDIENSLIKVHAQAGYDILQGIDFPWPIAQMVLQHHERLDGSGYPQGLKGDAILLEARILSVADVVEAMSSHRPYRPGLGIEVALEEITKQRGIHFDPQAVDACLAVFREQGYSFK